MSSSQPSDARTLSSDLSSPQLQDLELMRSLFPCPDGHTQDEWDELLLLEVPSVLGLASSAADVLDLDTEGDTPVNSDPSASPGSSVTSVPYSPSSGASRGSGINVDMSDIPPVHPTTTQSPAERMARELLASGTVTGQAMTELLDLLPHTGRPIHQEQGHGYTQRPRQFLTGAYARGPNTGLMRSVHSFPLTTLLMSRIMRSCAPAAVSPASPCLAHFLQGGLWVEDACQCFHYFAVHMSCDICALFSRRSSH